MFYGRTMMKQGEWFKSTKSGAAGHCVEALENGDGAVSVRNSKSPEGGTVAFTADEWSAFVAGVKAGEFDPTV